jgi:hypothetical protein
VAAQRVGRHGSDGGIVSVATVRPRSMPLGRKPRLEEDLIKLQNP